MEGVVPRVGLFDSGKGRRLVDLQLFGHIKSIADKEKLRNGQETAYSNVKSGEINESNDIQYIPPLSAYSASDDVPFIPVRNLRKGKLKLSVTEMRYEDFEKRMYSIRKSGWNSLRPIGVKKTMAEMKRDRHLRRAEVMALDQPIERTTNPNTMNYQENFLDPSMQISSENQDTYSGNNNDLDVDRNPSDLATVGEGDIPDYNSRDHVETVDYNHSEPNSSVVAGNDVVHEEEEEEDEISYDYDAEYARVEIDEEDDEDGNDGDRSRYLEAVNNSGFGIRGTITGPGIDRNLSIQQFVEATSRSRNAYDDIYSEDGDISTNSVVDNHLSVGNISSDLNSDAHDLTEIPTINISDTIDNSDIARSSRVSSLQNR